MGILYLVATPIGNLEDVTLRALRVLSQVGLIAAEDTRHTRKLLTHYQIPARLISYHEHNKLTRLEQVLEALAGGDVALVSDAGTPGLSDPGYELVRAALDAGHAVSPIPGASAPAAALVASGLPTDAFVFVGYLPRRSQERRKAMAAVASESRTLIAFEVPHRLRESLADLEDVLGPERSIAVCRELTKVHEEIVRGPIAEVRRTVDAVPPRGEITLVIGGAAPRGRWSETAVREALAEKRAAGIGRSEAARQVAGASGWERRLVYRLAGENHEPG